MDVDQMRRLRRLLEIADDDEADEPSISAGIRKKRLHDYYYNRGRELDHARNASIDLPHDPRHVAVFTPSWYGHEMLVDLRSADIHGSRDEPYIDSMQYLDGTEMASDEIEELENDLPNLAHDLRWERR